MRPIEAIVGYLRQPIDCSVPDAQQREAEAIVAALDAAGFAIVPKEATHTMICASVPAFEDIENALKIAWVHGFTLKAKTEDPPIKQAWRAMVATATRAFGE